MLKKRLDTKFWFPFIILNSNNYRLNDMIDNDFECVYYNFVFFVCNKMQEFHKNCIEKNVLEETSANVR